MKFNEITDSYVASFADYKLIYERGLEYYQHGMVHGLIADSREISAEVEGSNNSAYKVSILEAEEGEDLRASCDCPFQGWICKHIVAVLLAYLNRNGERILAAPRTPSTEIETLGAQLRTLGLDKLVDVLLTLAKDNEALRRNLLLAAGGPAGQRLTPRSNPLLSAVREEIRFALAPRSQRTGRYEGFIDRHAMPEVIRELRRIKNSAHLADPYIAAHIYWEMADQCLRALRSADDSEGTMSALIAASWTDYAGALNKSEISRATRHRHIDRLLTLFYAQDGKLSKSIFNAALALCKEKEDYEMLLKGLKEQLAGSGMSDQRRAVYQELLVSVYKHSGDEAEYLKELARSLTSPSDWLQLADHWKKRGQIAEAITVLEEGLKKFPSHMTLFYRPLLHLYQESNDPQNAQSLLIRYFNARPSFELYEEIAALVEHSSHWPDLRDQLIGRIKGSAGCTYDWIRLCLREGWDKEAVEAVLDSNIDYFLRAMVADVVKETNPDAAVELYKSVVQSLVSLRSPEAHQLAAKEARVLKHLLLKQSSGNETWHHYLEILRKENHNRPTVIEAFRGL